MTIVYLGEVTNERNDFRDDLEEAGFEVVYGSNDMDVIDYEEQFGDVVVLYETGFGKVVEPLKQKFNTIELKSYDDLDEVKKTLTELSTRIPSR